MSTEFLRQVPFLRLLIPFLAGIILSFILPVNAPFLFILIITTTLLCFCFTIIKKLSQNYALRWIFGLSLSLGLLAVGMLLTSNKLNLPGRHFKETTKPFYFTGIIIEPPEEHPKSVSVFMNVRTKGESSPEKMLIYFEKDSIPRTMKAGDLIFFRAFPGQIEKNGNPYEFDYKRYLWYKGIKYSAFVNRKSWICLSHRNLPFYRMFAYDLREKLLKTFTRLGLSGNELGVASALTIGDKTNLDSEIRQAYIASGTMHILAVSGMHVALLYWVLNFALSFLMHIRHGKFAWLVIILFCIWFYALITGMAPSINRASVMITFVAIGKVFNRPVNIFNPLSASAFFLLMLNPLSLFDIGFQLSYAAVVSIVIFQPYLHKWFEIKNWCVYQVWNIMAVTLAAQILTTPISIFYFHQFPNLFLFSNIIMIPLSTLIMYSSLVLIPLSEMTWISEILSKGYEAMIWLLNKTVTTIEDLPFALTKNLYLSFWEICVMYILIIFAALFLIRRKPWYLLASLLVGLILSTGNFIERYYLSTQKQIVFYHDNKNCIIRFQHGITSTWLVDERTEKLSKYIETAASAEGSTLNEIVELRSVMDSEKFYRSGLWVHGRFLQFYGQKFYLSNGSETDSLINAMVDRIILYHPSRIRKFHFQVPVILNPSLPKSKADNIKQGFAEIPVYDMDDSGALVIHID